MQKPKTRTWIQGGHVRDVRVLDLAVLKDCLGQLSVLSECLQKRGATIVRASDYVKRSMLW